MTSHDLLRAYQIAQALYIDFRDYEDPMEPCWSWTNYEFETFPVPKGLWDEYDRRKAAYDAECAVRYQKVLTTYWMYRDALAFDQFRALFT